MKSKLQNCTLDMSVCSEIIGITSLPIFLGDIDGTTKSILSVNNTPYILDKSLNTIGVISGVIFTS